MLNKRLISFRFAFAGLVDLFRTQPNAWIHLFIAIAVMVAGFVFKLTPCEWALITFAVTLVFALEALNTAIEYLTDLISPGHHPLAGKAKDASAAAVLIAAVGAATVGFIIFLPKIIAFFH